MLKFLVVFLTAVFTWLCSATLIQGLASYSGLETGEMGVFFITVFLSTIVSLIFGVITATLYD